jgi:hypothetical protein
MEEKIKERCEEVGISPDVLTKKEREELIKEIEAEERGEMILDGVLSNPEIKMRGWE